jgi:hypothetical protein
MSRISYSNIVQTLAGIVDDALKPENCPVPRAAEKTAYVRQFIEQSVVHQQPVPEEILKYTLVNKRKIAVRSWDLANYSRTANMLSLIIKINAASRELVDLGNGNMYDDVHRSRGATYRLLPVVRSTVNQVTGTHHIDKTSGARALMASAMRVGNCWEYSAVTFELARSLNLQDVFLVQAYCKDADHCFVIYIPLPKEDNARETMIAQLTENATIAMKGEKDLSALKTRLGADYEKNQAYLDHIASDAHKKYQVAMAALETIYRKNGYIGDSWASLTSACKYGEETLDYHGVQDGFSFPATEVYAFHAPNQTYDQSFNLQRVVYVRQRINNEYKQFGGLANLLEYNEQQNENESGKKTYSRFLDNILRRQKVGTYAQIDVSNVSNYGKTVQKMAKVKNNVAQNLFKKIRDEKLFQHLITANHAAEYTWQGANRGEKITLRTDMINAGFYAEKAASIKRCFLWKNNKIGDTMMDHMGIHGVLAQAAIPIIAPAAPGALRPLQSYLGHTMAPHPVPAFEPARTFPPIDLDARPPFDIQENA